MSLGSNELFNPTAISSSKNNSGYYDAIASASTAYYSVIDSNILDPKVESFLTDFIVNVQSFYTTLYQVDFQERDIFFTLGRMSSAFIYDVAKVADPFKYVKILTRGDIYLLSIVTALSPLLGRDIPATNRYLILRTFFNFVYNFYKSYQRNFGPLSDLLLLPLSDYEKNVIIIENFIYQVLQCLFDKCKTGCDCNCKCKCNRKCGEKHDNSKEEELKTNDRIFRYLFELTKVLYEAVASITIADKSFAIEAYTLIDKILYQLRHRRCNIDRPQLIVSGC